MYILGFIALSGALHLLLWPPARRWLGLCSGGVALLLAVVLGGQLASVGGGWLALDQKLVFMASGATEPVVEQALPQPLAAALLPLVDALLLHAQQALPGLALHLGAGLMFLGAYLACKLVLVALTWGWQWLTPARARRRVALGRVPWLLDGALALLGLLLAAQPYLAVLTLHGGLLYALGVWIMLLELRQWLASAVGMPVSAWNL